MKGRNFKEFAVDLYASQQVTQKGRRAGKQKSGKRQEQRGVTKGKNRKKALLFQ